jgi:prepilin-type N-terminal cleavage/methylation domain-containing protein
MVRNRTYMVSSHYECIQRFDLARRSGFTLIELLVVIGIILTLATITVSFFPRINNYQKVQQGATRLQGWLLTARLRAQRDQVPRGIRLVVSNNLVTDLQYIEQPDVFSVGTLTIVDASNATVSSGVDLSGGLGTNQSLWPVQANDFLEINGVGPIYRISAIASSQITNSHSNYPPPAANLPYRVIRAPRVSPGDALLQLPQDVVIDMNTTSVAGSQRSGSTLMADSVTGNFDILFAPSGAVMRSAGQAGKIILWIRDVTQDSSAPGDQFLVGVLTRAGNITVHPVDVTPDTVNTGYYLDPYSYLRDGKDSGV